MEMDIPAYRIHHILRVCPGLLKIRQRNASKKSICPSAVDNEIELSSDGKKRHMIDQLVSEAIVQLTKPVWRRKEHNIVDGILHDIFLEDAKRKLYGTLM
jgi:hypothetical protein